MIKIKIKDVKNRDYCIEDLEKFVDHIKKYHNTGSTIHEENGYYFVVDDTFRKSLFKLLK